MHAKMEARPGYAKQMRRFRSRTVEPVLGTLLNFLGLRKVYTRGIKQAHKHVLMAALTYNLKKYVKFISKKPSGTPKATSALQTQAPIPPASPGGRPTTPDRTRRSKRRAPIQASMCRPDARMVKINRNEFFRPGLTLARMGL